MRKSWAAMGVTTLFSRGKKAVDKSQGLCRNVWHAYGPLQNTTLEQERGQDSPKKFFVMQSRGLERRPSSFSRFVSECLLPALEGMIYRRTLVVLWASLNPFVSLSGRWSLFQAVQIHLSPTYQMMRYPCCLRLLCVTLRKQVVRLCSSFRYEKRCTEAANLPWDLSHKSQ